MTAPHPSRRGALKTIGLAAAGAAMLSPRIFAQSANAHLLIPGAEACVLLPEAAEGPFYFDPVLHRRDITEGKPGLPLLVRLQIVDTGCVPFEDARVDIWHCDASGAYSGYAGQPGNLDARGETFLRGTQFADSAGIVEFETIYPGWYPGRTTHIHFKVFLDEMSVLTGQLYFPEFLNNNIYASFADYSRDRDRTTFNDNDILASQAGESSIATLIGGVDALSAALIIGVDASNTS